MKFTDEELKRIQEWADDDKFCSITETVANHLEHLAENVDDKFAEKIRHATWTVKIDPKCWEDN